MRIVALVLGIAAALTTTIAAADSPVGGRRRQLPRRGPRGLAVGLPTKDVVFTAGSAPIKVDPNGDFEVEQMYVQYVKLAQPKAKYPLLLWHGGGLTGVTWETKPDGKPGWQMFFLRAGHDVYVSDAVERGRASWARYPEIFTSEPLFRTKKQAWEDFRIGPVGSYKLSPTERVALPGQLFPDRGIRSVHEAGRAALVDDRRADPGRLQPARAEGLPLRDRRAQPGRQLRLQRGARRAGQGEGADRRSSRRARPSPRRPPAARSRVSRTSSSGVTTSGRASSGSASCRLPSATADALRAEGGVADWWSCPSSASPGNGHMLMMDKNSDQIAQMIQKWMADRGLMK
jgi:hypothetical protein